jgi:hypothetical protein
MTCCDSALAARRILAAVEAGNNTGLEAQLLQARSAPENLPAGSAERWELLDAIAGWMVRSLRRKVRIDDAGVHLRLLRHLAEEGVSGRGLT